MYLGKIMEDLDQDVQEIDPLVLNQTRHKKYRRRRLIEPLDPYFCYRNRRIKRNQQTIDVKEEENTPILSDPVANFIAEEATIR
jgi:hypothetical protein